MNILLKKIVYYFILSTVLFTFCYCGNSGSGAGENNGEDALYTIKTKEIKEIEEIEEKISILDEKPEIKVNIGIYKSSPGGILLLADALNFFEEQGVYPSFTLYPDYPALVEAFKKGKVDIATIGLYDSLLLLLEDIEFVGVLPLSYRGITFASKYKNNIKTITPLKGKDIGITEDSVDYILLHTALSTAGLDFDDVNLYTMPKPVIKKAFDENYIDAGFFSSLYHPPMTDINIILGPTRHKAYKVENLLINKEFVNDEKDAIELIIDAYKRALLYYKQHKDSALEIISHKNRLDVSPREFEKMLSYEPLIEITNNKKDGINDVETNEDIIRNKLFHTNGIYNKDTGIMLDFIVNNIKKYKDKKYKDKLEDIKLNLLRSRYFTVIYLASVGFEHENIDNIKISTEMKTKWAKTLTKSDENKYKKINPADYKLKKND